MIHAVNRCAGFRSFARNGIGYGVTVCWDLISIMTATPVLPARLQEIVEEIRTRGIAIVDDVIPADTLVCAKIPQ